MPEPTADAVCLNCGAELADRFCPSCGQEHREPIPALRSWLREVAAELLMAEARLPRSLKRLILTPGHLTREWWEGRRARWVSPLRLYLLGAVPFFLLLSIASDPEDIGAGELVLLGSMMLEEQTTALLDLPLPPTNMTAEQRTEFIAESERALATRDSTVASTERQARDVMSRVTEYLPALIGLIMVPLLALLLRDSATEKLPYIAYVILSLHVHAAVYLLGLVGVLVGLAVPATALAGVGHLYVVRRRLLSESRRRAASLTLFLVFGYTGCFSGVYFGGGLLLIKLG